MPCKQIVENAPMHDTTRRLYEAALVLSRGAATKPSEVAAFYGVTQQVLKNWENRGISQQGMISICELRPAIQLAWLSRGDGPAPHTTPSAQPQPPQPKALEEPAGTPISGLPTIQVPTLANAASMGSGNDVLHDDVMIGTITLSADWVAKRIRPTSPSALRCMHAYGDSMSPTFEDGDILLVDTGAINPSSADGVYVLEANHRLFIKRVTERLGGGHDVTSDNPRVKTVSDLNGGHEVSVKGRVVWAWNGKKL